jgi:hypothetical protein
MGELSASQAHCTILISGDSELIAWCLLFGGLFDGMQV